MRSYHSTNDNGLQQYTTTELQASIIDRHKQNVAGIKKFDGAKQCL